MSIIKLALADDQLLFLRGLKLLIRTFDNMEIVIEASNGQALLDAIPLNPPDVILMDLKMPVMDGIEATRLIKEEYPHIKIILLSMYDDDQIINHMMKNGANGYLLKNEEPHILREAIESVITKDYYFNDYVSKALLHATQDNMAALKPTALSSSRADDSAELTRRELEILELICKEYTTGEIAQQLYISTRTVEGHRKNLLEKTGARNTAGLIIFAIRNNLVHMNT